MLKPLTGSPGARPIFVVLDIENWPNGDVLTIDICWREHSRKVHKLFHNWKTFYNWLIAKARRDKRFRTIYAHNGGGWDWLSLAHYLLRGGKKKHHYVTGIIATSKLITMCIQIGKRFTINLCDSLQLLRSSLDDLARKFEVTNKIKLNGLLPHEVYLSDKDLFYQYVEADTESLLEVLEQAHILLNLKVAPIGDFGFTIGSTAMKVFRTMLSREIAVPYDEKVKLHLRQGYKGGRVEVFQCGYYPNVTIYDINSLYPYAMLTTDVPISDRGVWTTELNLSLPGCYELEYEQRDRSIPAVLMGKGIGQYQGAGHYYTPEIALLKEVDPTATIKIKSGYIFLDSEKLFQDYVNRLYNLRLEDRDGPISLLAKFLLNSLYGKFAQNPVRTKLVHLTDWQHIYDACGGDAHVKEFNAELGVYAIETHHAANFEHVGIAAMITSQARCLLYRGMLNAGISQVLYCDTDSVHVSGLCNLPVSGKIGDWKKEFQGEGVYVGKKLYALRNWKWHSCGSLYQTKIRAKGVTVGGRNGSDIRFDDFVRIAKGQGESFKACYSSPATAKQVFDGADPCKFGPRTRTIRRTA